jgi:uncharacterized membrane protein
MIPVILAFHTIAAIVWVGGMAFALLVLRPAAAALPKPLAVALWRQVFQRFFALVWVAIVVLLASGYGTIFLGFGGFAAVGVHINIMQSLGLVMMILFVAMWAKPWRDFRRAVDAQQPEAAGKAMRLIRLVVIINLVLGVITAAVGATGSFWGY